MFKKIFLFHTFLLLIFPCFLIAREQEFDYLESDLLREFIQKGQIERQISNLSSIVNIQFRLYSRQMMTTTPEFQHELDQAVYNTFQEDKLYEVVEFSLKKDFNQERLISLLAWLDTSFGEEMTIYFVDVERPRFLTSDYSVWIQENWRYITSERYSLLEKLYESTKLQELQSKIFYHSIMTTLWPLYQHIHSQEDGETQPLDRSIQALVNRSSEKIKRHFIPSLFYRFRNVSEEDLQRYIDFIESEDGQWYIQTLNRAFQTALKISFLHADADLRLQFEEEIAKKQAELFL